MCHRWKWFVLHSSQFLSSEESLFSFWKAVASLIHEFDSVSQLFLCCLYSLWCLNFKHDHCPWECWCIICDVLILRVMWDATIVPEVFMWSLWCPNFKGYDVLILRVMCPCHWNVWVLVYPCCKRCQVRQLSCPLNDTWFSILYNSCLLRNQWSDLVTVVTYIVWEHCVCLCVCVSESMFYVCSQQSNIRQQHLCICKLY